MLFSKGSSQMTRFPRQWTSAAAAVLVGSFFSALAMHAAQTSRPIKGWQQGKGWGWVWGRDDEVEALNAMNDATRLSAMHLAKQGKVYDLGVTYDRTSYKWPGHSP